MRVGAMIVGKINESTVRHMMLSSRHSNFKVRVVTISSIEIKSHWGSHPTYRIVMLTPWHEDFFGGCLVWFGNLRRENGATLRWAKSRTSPLHNLPTCEWAHRDANSMFCLRKSSKVERRNTSVGGGEAPKITCVQAFVTVVESAR